MRIILMRHGETQNNILAMVSKDSYETQRLEEPELSEIGEKSCRRMGKEMGNLGFHIDKILCSG